MTRYSVQCRAIRTGRPDVMIEQYLLARGLVAKVKRCIGLQVITTIVMAEDEAAAIAKVEEFITGGRYPIEVLMSGAIPLQHK